MQGMNGLEKFRSGPWFRFSCQWRQFPSIIIFLGQIKSQHESRQRALGPQNHLRKKRGMGLGSRYNTASVMTQPSRVRVWAHLKIECSVPHLTVTILTHHAR